MVDWCTVQDNAGTSHIMNWMLTKSRLTIVSIPQALPLAQLMCLQLKFALQGKELEQMLDEDPALMERRGQCARRLELYKSARDEIESVSGAR